MRKRVEKSSLAIILDAHEAWVLNPTKGQCAKFHQVNLSQHNFEGRDLRGAKFFGCNLSGSNFSFCDLYDVVFDRSVLTGADLRFTNLEGASFRDSLLGGTLFCYRSLSAAQITDANLHHVRESYFYFLECGLDRIGFIYKSITRGKINASFWRGPIPEGAHERMTTFEKFLLGIPEGQKPEESQAVSLLKKWTEEFIADKGLYT